jgi:hypothetical protein
MITNMSTKESSHSMATAAVAGTCGMVAPRLFALPNIALRTNEAAIAPVHCAKTYRASSLAGNLPTDQKPIVTAGFKCAPERWPRALIMAVTTNAKARAIPTMPS